MLKRCFNFILFSQQQVTTATTRRTWQFVARTVRPALRPTSNPLPLSDQPLSLPPLLLQSSPDSSTPDNSQTFPTNLFWRPFASTHSTTTTTTSSTTSTMTSWAVDRSCFRPKTFTKRPPSCCSCASSGPRASPHFYRLFNNFKYNNYV